MNPQSSRAKSRYGFPKRARLLRSADFRKVYDCGTRRNLGFLLAFALPNESSDSRIGFTVPRAVGNAVRRNQLKRRMREAVRKHRDELGPGWDIVFNVRQTAAKVAFSDIEETVRKFFLSCAGARRPSSGLVDAGGEPPRRSASH